MRMQHILKKHIDDENVLHELLAEYLPEEEKYFVRRVDVEANELISMTETRSLRGAAALYFRRISKGRI